MKNDFGTYCLKNFIPLIQSWEVLYLVLCIWVLIIHSLKQKQLLSITFSSYLPSNCPSLLFSMFSSTLFKRSASIFKSNFPPLFKLSISPRLALNSFNRIILLLTMAVLVLCKWTFRPCHDSVPFYMFENALAVTAFVTSVYDNHSISQKQDVSSKKFILKFETYLL